MMTVPQETYFIAEKQQKKYISNFSLDLLNVIELYKQWDIKNIEFTE